MKLPSAFTHSFEQAIWKIHTDAYSNWVVLELRNEKTQETSFAAIEGGELRWKELQLEEPWWLNSVGLYNRQLLIHQYDDSPYPSPEFLFALSVEQQDISWVLEAVSFQTADAQFVEVAPSKPKEHSKVQYHRLSTGEEVTPHTFSPKRASSSIQCYYADTPFFNTIAQFFAQNALPTPQWQVEYWENAQCIVIATYHATQEQRMYVFSTKGVLLKEWCLQKRAKGKAPQAFMVYGQALWAVQEGTTLVVQPLS